MLWDGHDTSLLLVNRLRNTLLLLVLAALLAPAGASASSGQVALFQDDALLVTSGDGVRETTLDELGALGVDMIKVQLHWASVAPHGERKPDGFDGSDPSGYGGWQSYDEFVADARAHGFEVMMALSPPAPDWATPARRGEFQGSNRPDASEFGKFAEAAARRFPGIEVWSLMNEPNHPGFLHPQSTRSGRPVSPHVYRGLVRAGVSGLRRGGAGDAEVLFGELLPIAGPRRGPARNLQPLDFLREFFCLDPRMRPFRGRAARLRGCDGYERLRGLDGFAYHPYTRKNGPREPEPPGANATIRSLGRVFRVLDGARRRGRIAGGRLPMWITEYGFQSDPPDPNWAKLERIPEFWALSELWLAKRNRRVRSMSWYTMKDTPGVNGLWQGGLRFADGRPKEAVYAGYRLPILVRQLGPHAIEVLGAARPSGAGARVQVQERRKGRYVDIGVPHTVTNERGYFSVRFKPRNAVKRRFRYVVGEHASLTVRPITLYR